jgi:hypothetical protein
MTTPTSDEEWLDEAKQHFIQRVFEYHSDLHDALYLKSTGMKLHQEINDLFGDLAGRLKAAREEAKAEAEAALHQLNWMQILRKAIDSRPSSWKPEPVWEWRNASDEVMFSVLWACYEAGIFVDPWKAAAEYVRKQQKGGIGHGSK